MEEWASFSEQQFRLDLISSAGRTSYLTNGKTGETFRYKAFTCEPITEKSDEFQVFAKLFLGYPISDQSTLSTGPVLVYGLGPLWLRAKERALSVDYRPADKLNPLTVEGKHKLSVELDQYILGMPMAYAQDKGNLRLRFLFPAGLNHFVEIVDWLVADSKGRTGVQARVRLINLDLSPLDGFVFQIPVGYGCTRADKINQQMALDVGLSLLHEGFPNQISLGITTSRPNDDIISASSSWSSHKYTASLMRYSMALPPSEESPKDSESYFVSLMQERDEQSGRLKRTKRIWWLPTSKVDDKTQALVYEFDLSTSDETNCRMSHRNLKDQLVLNFPGAPKVPDSPPDQSKKRMMLSLDQILFLLQDNTNYHVISNIEQSDSSAIDQRDGRFKSLYYEKRVNHFELTYEGAVAWSGPVSIVKQVNSYSQYLNQQSEKKSDESKSSNSSKRLKLPEDYKTKLSLFFYSNDFQNLHYKAVIELLGNHEVDLDYLQKQLDVSNCFPLDKQKSIVVKYPIENPSITKQLEEKLEQIRTQMFQNLFEKTVFFPLQVANLEASFDYFNLQLRMTLLDLPLTHTFKLQRGSRLIKDREGKTTIDRNALHVSSASSADKCAERCDHYNCFRFSFDPELAECHIELIPGKAKLVEKPSCELYSYVKRSDALYWRSSRLANEMTEVSRPQLSPRSVVEMLEQMLMNEQSADDLERVNPLNVRLHINSVAENDNQDQDQTKTELILRPMSIESDLESMNEFQKLSQYDLNESSDDQTDGGPFNRLQYALVIEDRAFNQDIGQVLHGLASYEDCAQYCENNDCRSFSYCQQNEECRVTNLHDEKYISRYSKPKAFVAKCNVYSLDYLTKFEDYGKMILPAEVRKTSDGSSAADCANICMDEQSFACQGFYFCRIPAKSLIGGLSDLTKCYLVDQHVDDHLRHKHSLQRIPSDSNPEAGNSESREDCSFFSRSYLAQFEKFYGKKIVPSSTSGEPTFVVAGSDAEHCAKRCIERSCLAFDICPSPGNPFIKQQCRFALRTKSSNQVEADPKCTTFMLSDKSEFNKGKQKFIGESKPDQEAPVDDSEANRPPPVVVDENAKNLRKEDINSDLLDKLDSRGGRELDLSSSSSESGWHSLWRFVWSLTLGISLGGLFVVAWNEAYARGWFDQMTNRFVSSR